uniref:VHS domain-containing protein n=1 Tax=Hemiselmis tepida TaxID=464990 RepID=A0A7S0Z2N1_9CRYP
MFSALSSAFEDAFDINGEVGRLIDVACSESTTAPDRQIILKICDTINANPREGSRDAARALRRKLKAKNGRVLLLAVTVLEQVMQNCGPELHASIATKEFMGDVSGLVLNPNLDASLHRKTVQLIQHWGEGFRHMQDKLPAFYDTYSTLRAQGVRFPEYDVASAPVFSLRQVPRPTVVAAGRTFQATQPGTLHSSQTSRRTQQQQQQQRPAAAGAGRSPAVEDLRPAFDSAKLMEDLEQVTTEATLLCEILDAATQSGDGGAESRKMSRELARNCNMYQPRIVTLMEQVQEDELILKLLAVNEELLRVLDIYKSRNQPPAPPDHSAAPAFAGPAQRLDPSLDALEAHRLSPPPAIARPGVEPEADLLGLLSDNAGAPASHETHHTNSAKHKVKLGAKPLHERKKAAEEGSGAAGAGEGGAATVGCDGTDLGVCTRQDAGSQVSTAADFDVLVGAGAGEAGSDSVGDAAAAAPLVAETPGEAGGQPRAHVDDRASHTVTVVRDAAESASASAPVPAIAPPPRAATAAPAAGRLVARDEIDDLLGI